MDGLTIPREIGTRSGRKLCALAVLGALGCTGATIDAGSSQPGATPPGVAPPAGSGPPPGGGTTPGSTPTPPGATPVAPGTVDVGFSPLRRLTSDQYRNTVRDLLGMKDAPTLVPATALPSDGSLVERFASNI